MATNIFVTAIMDTANTSETLDRTGFTLEISETIDFIGVLDGGWQFL